MTDSQRSTALHSVTTSTSNFDEMVFHHVVATDERAVAITVAMLREFAEESGAGSRFSTDEDTLQAMMTDARCALEVVLVMSGGSSVSHEGVPQGLLLISQRWATFTGQSILYLNDIWVRPESRGNGLGAKAMAYLSQLAQQRECVRVEWDCDTANTAGERFYSRLGAQPNHQWRLWQVSTTR